MIVARLHLLDLMRTARTDMLAAMDSLPAEAELSRAGFGVPLVVAQQFSSAHQVLVSDAESYRKPWMIRQVIEGGLGENLFTTDGDAWLARRRPCAPVFGVHQMEALAGTMVATVSDVVESWRTGEIDIQAAMTDLTMHVALRGLLGTTDSTSEVAAEVRTEFEEILEWITFRFTRPLSPPAFVPTSRNRRLGGSKKRLRRAIERLIDQRREHDDGSVDVLSQLVVGQRDKTHDLSTDAIVDECVGFLFAGHETTASTLTWALYELSRRSDLQDVVATEASKLNADRATLVRDIGAMTRTSAVVEEALRLYPAGISIARSAKRTTEIGSEKIRRGTLVMIPVYAIQRSPAVWERPNEFDPTRHDLGSGEGLLPFGLGPRRCLGARFARTELRIALGFICSTWRLAYDRPTPPEPIVAPSLRAAGDLTLRITERTP